MTTFHINHARVGWDTTFEDAQAWRCIVRPGRPSIEISVTGAGTGNESPSLAREQALRFARIVATAVPLR